jgi:4-hydroxy-tetrahydrodipicolinate synthase
VRTTVPELQSVNVAAITPRGKAGEVNFGATFELIDYLSAARVGGIALFTAWGEFPALAADDRARLTYLAVKRSRVPVLAGVGSGTLDISLALARDARDAGAAALLAPPPLCALSNQRYDQDDIREYYLHFAGQLGGGVPLFLSGEIARETALALLETGSFAGIETGDSLDSWGGRTVLSGDDGLFVRARSAGLGVLSPAACAAPELAMALDRAIATGDSERAGRLRAMWEELAGWMARLPQPAGLKTAVATRGVQTGQLAAPLPPKKQKSLGQFREWFADWLPGTRKLTAHG